jgi:hypothetical protein
MTSTLLPRRSLLLVTCLVSFKLAGCATAPPKKQALDTAAIAAVQGEIKRQVGVYLLAAQKPVPGNPKDFWCGTGDIDFDISSIKADLTVTNETIASAGVALKIPWGAVTIGPSGSIKGDATNTQELVYKLWPLDISRQTALKSEHISGEPKPAPISDVLLSLREGLINSAKRTATKEPQACFTDYSPDKPASDAGDTFKLGLSFTTDATGGLEIKIGILDLTSTTEWKGTTGNTLTVSFVQRGLAQLQRAKDAVDAECKYPKDDKSDACVKAVKAYQKLQDEGRGLGAR